jgi:hypothetical protein
MSPREVQSLQEIARAHGGSLSINPDTGLVEAGFLKNLLPMIAGMGITALTGGAAAPWMIGLGVGGVQAARTGSLEKGLMAGLGAYGGSGLMSGITAAAGNTASELAAKDIALGGQGGSSAAAQYMPSASQNFMSGVKGLGTEAGRNAAINAMGGGFNAAKTTAMALAPALTDEGDGGDTPKDDERYNYEFNPGRVANPNEGYTGAATGERTYFRPSYTRLPNSKGMAEGGAIPYDSSGVARFDNGGATNDQGLAAAAAAQGVQPFTFPPAPTSNAGSSPPPGNIQPVANNPYYTMTGQSGDAYRYLMGLGPTSGTTPTTPTPPPYTPPTTPTSSGGDGGSSPPTTPTSPPPTFNPTPDLEPELPSPDEDFPPTYQEPELPSPDEDFPPTYQEPVMPSPDEDFPSTYPEPVMPSPDEDFPSTYQEPVMPSPDEDFPETVPRDKSFIDDPDREDVGPSRGLMKNQEELPEEFDKYLQPVPSPDEDFPSTYVPSPDADFPSTYSEPSMPSPDADFPSTYSEPSMPSPDDDFPSTYSEPTVYGNSYSRNPYYNGYTYDTSSIDNGGGGGGSGGRHNMIEAESDFFGDEDSFDYMDMADGGLMAAHRYAMGGMSHLGGYSDGGRLLRGPGDGVSDSIPASIGKHRQPARLADGEFVVPARIVSELGNGSTEAGARKLYAMMDRIQAGRKKSIGKGNVAKNTRADKYLPA